MSAKKSQLNNFGTLVLVVIFVIIIIIGTVPAIRAKVVDGFNIIGNMLGIKLDLPGGSTVACDFSYCRLNVLHTPPSLSETQIEAILTSVGSPAVGTGKVFVSESESTGIDNAFALAFFRHESGFGTKGVAKTTKSVGNIKYTNGCAFEYKGFCGYNSWEDGIKDWYRRIDKYYINEGKETLGEILVKYAPCKENDVEAYIASVTKFIKDNTNRDVSSCQLA